MKKQPIHKCLNCDSGFDYEFEYCPKCGQKNTDGRITFSELWTEFQDAIFNIESRTWRTLVAIFIPGKLTLQYFAGRHRRYVHPLRLLIVTSILMIIALSFQDVQSSTNQGYVIKDRIMENYERQRVHGILNNIMDNTNQSFPEPQTKIITDTIINVFEDSLYSLLQGNGDRYGDSIDLNQYVSLSNLDEDEDEDGYVYENVAKQDFLTMTEDQLVEKYKGDSKPLDQLIFKQKAKYIKDESQLASAVVGRITIAILLMMPCIALILYFLYLRRQFYYIENLIFSFHIHAFSFIVMTIYIIGWNIFPEWALPVFISIVEAYLFISMLKVYQQSMIKTFFKFIVLNILYCALLLLFLIGTFFVSFLLL